ncbi:hypothetical protein BKA24_001668 [Microbacterium marinum]|uniref:Protein of unknwon function n=1 Tax=Microbacterium marinum TaxID=421115 RepID=A0A7W7BQH5_9MICO|nr:DUF3310 domain-containing protein [Microbacterium marinum]MBB4666959.1 hypothetical protein [Microbacterium marinum]
MATTRRSESEAPSSTDAVNHPSHYTRFPGVEVIDLTEHLNFCRGNAVKYIARAGAKDPAREIEDLEKARWYIDREIERTRREKVDRKIREHGEARSAALASEGIE